MKHIAVWCLGLLLPLLVQAAPDAYRAAQDPSGLSEPATVLRRGIETLTGYLDDNHGVPPARLRQFLETEIVPYFDFSRMSYWAAGPLNRYLNPHQRQQLAMMVKGRFFNAMAEQLANYHQSRLQYLPLRGNPLAGDVMLGVRVSGVGAYPVQLDFRLYRSQQGWKVYDVMANGVSAVAHYRAELAWMVRRYGVEGVLARLAQPAWRWSAR